MNELGKLSERINTAMSRLEGWCDLEKALSLAGIIVGYRPQLTVEIGIFGGKSFIPMALAHQAVNSGKIMGIEPWNKEIAVAAQTENESREWWANINYGALEKNFRDCLRQYDLEQISIIMKQASNRVQPPANIGLLHVDGAHNMEAVNDVVRYSTQVLPGGFVVLDDLNWHGGGVTAAEQRLIALGFRKLYHLGTGAVYQKSRT